MLSSDGDQVARWKHLRGTIARASVEERASMLFDEAQSSRRNILDMIMNAKAGHIGGDYSVIDILTTLYFAVLELDPENPERTDTDCVVLSKGHASAALYATLAAVGYFPLDRLLTFMGPLSPLNGHPDRNKVPGVSTNTGPLGHGLPFAVGRALGSRLQGKPVRVVVVVGDGELQEGSNWEALMSAAHFRLDNLLVVVDRNTLQQGAGTEETSSLAPLEDKLRAFGCEVRETGGHDFTGLIEASRASETGRPVAVIAHTVKGRGVSFIENRVEWHHKVPSADQAVLAMKELAA